MSLHIHTIVSFLAGEDYVAFTEQLVIVDSLRACINITLLDDNTPEPNETFAVNLTSTDPITVVSSPATAVVTINDEDTCKLYLFTIWRV